MPKFCVCSFSISYASSAIWIILLRVAEDQDVTVQAAAFFMRFMRSQTSTNPPCTAFR